MGWPSLLITENQLDPRAPLEHSCERKARTQPWDPGAAQGVGFQNRDSLDPLLLPPPWGQQQREYSDILVCLCHIMPNTCSVWAVQAKSNNLPSQEQRTAHRADWGKDENTPLSRGPAAERGGSSWACKAKPLPPLRVSSSWCPGTEPPGCLRKASKARQTRTMTASQKGLWALAPELDLGHRSSFVLRLIMTLCRQAHCLLCWQALWEEPAPQAWPRPHQCSRVPTWDNRPRDPPNSSISPPRNTTQGTESEQSWGWYSYRWARGKAPRAAPSPKPLPSLASDGLHSPSWHPAAVGSHWGWRGVLWGWQWELPVVPNLGSVVLQTPHHRLETHHTVRAGLVQKSNLSYVPRSTQIQEKTERNKDSERNRDSESQKKQFSAASRKHQKN